MRLQKVYLSRRDKVTSIKFEALKKKEKFKSKKHFRRKFAFSLFDFARDYKTNLLFFVNPSSGGTSS